MGREVRRVPLDFDWLLNQPWEGFLLPKQFHFPKCAVCDGDSYSPEARAIAKTFYSHQIGGHNAEALAWCDKLGQKEVDNLIAEGRLRRWKGGAWETVQLTAEEVNAANRRGARGMDGHDGINRWIAIRFRCEALGITLKCPTCSGHGDIATDEQRAASEAWEGKDPPEGDGYQIWETVSEGSPISPVFATPEELAQHMMTTRWGADQGTSYETWLRFIIGPGWAPSLVASAAGVQDGVSAVSGA